MPRSDPRPGEITELLHAWARGERGVEAQIWEAVYPEVKRLARQVRRGRLGRGGTTSIVHDAYLRLHDAADVSWRERGHFFAVAARAMRFVLADRARRRLAGKRGAGLDGEIPAEAADPGAPAPEDVLAVHQALERLEEIAPRQVSLVELHHFSGLSLDQAAEVLGVSRRTAMRDWKAVRMWLHGELKAAGPR